MHCGKYALREAESPFAVRHEVNAVLLVSFRRAQLQPSALQPLDNDPCHNDRPGRADQYGHQLDEKQLETSAEEEATAVSQTSTYPGRVRSSVAGVVRHGCT